MNAIHGTFVREELLKCLVESYQGGLGVFLRLFILALKELHVQFICVQTMLSTP